MPCGVTDVVVQQHVQTAGAGVEFCQRMFPAVGISHVQLSGAGEVFTQLAGQRAHPGFVHIIQADEPAVGGEQPGGGLADTGGGAGNEDALA